MKYLMPLLLFMFVSMSAQSDFERAENYFNSGQFNSAKSLFEKHLKQHPSDLKSIEYLGDIQCHLAQWSAAIPFYEQLKNQNPKLAEYQYKYGGALAMSAKESNMFKALSMVGPIKSAFERAIKLNPSHIGARWALIELYLQLPSILGGSEKTAIRYANELSRISTVDGYLSHGHIAEYYGRYTTAETQYKKAITAGNSQTTYQKLADLYQHKLQQPKKAQQLWAAYNEKNKS